MTAAFYAEDARWLDALDVLGWWLPRRLPCAGRRDLHHARPRCAETLTARRAVDPARPRLAAVSLAARDP